MSATTALDAAPMAAAIDASTTPTPNEDTGQSIESAEARAKPAQDKPSDIAESAGGLPLEAEEAQQRHKALTIARIRLSSAPAALKERFAALAEEATDAAAVESCLKAVEESLPEFLTGDRGDAARPKHPAGEVFFRGHSDQLTDEQAEEIAQRQLARSGLLRGQRVRVAD